MISCIKFSTKYSIKEGIVKLNNIIYNINKKNYLGIILTDYYNLTLIDVFYNYCILYNIKPIIGCEIYIITKNNNIKGKITLISKNYKGIKELNKLINKGWIRNKGNEPYNKINELNKTKNIIIILSNNKNYYLKKITNQKNKINNIIKIINNKNELLINNNNKLIIKNNYKNIYIKHLKFYNKKEYKKFLIKETILNKKLFNKKKYLSNIKKIKRIKKINLINKNKNNINKLKNLFNIIKKCNLILEEDITKKKNINNNSSKKIVRKTIKILITLIKKNIINNKNKKKFIGRIKKEIKIIIASEFIEYFLIAKEFIKWCNKKKIIVGSGRGSCSSSLLSYIFDITAINPLYYGLLFERFLNIKKREEPDFDIDFCVIKRDKILEYIKKKYSKYCVANIVTFNKFLLNNSIRDCGKIIGFKFQFINNIVKKINNLIKKKKTNKKFKKFLYKDIKIKEIFKLSNMIKNLIKTLGVHAGGIIITPNNFYNNLPIQIIETEKNYITTQSSKENLEGNGMIKYDLLGLKTLTVLSKITKNIKINNRLKKININKEKTFKLINKGDTVGIFQIENKKLRNYIINIKPNNLNEIINIISLYRPGPIEMLKKYNNKQFICFKHKKINKLISNNLIKTRKRIIFQEQIMKIMQKIFGFNSNQSDILRKKFSSDFETKKYIKNVIKKLNKFKGIAIETIKTVAKYAGYSFNRAHGVPYALITYFIAYLKSKYKLQFYITQLNYSYENKKKTRKIIKDLRKKNIKLITPNLKNIKLYFNYNKNKKNIIIGLIVIKNIGIENSKTLINLLKKNNINNIYELWKCCKYTEINVSMIKSLIYCKMLKEFNYNRINLLKQIDKIINRKTTIKLINNNNNINIILFLYKKEREIIGCFHSNPYNNIKSVKKGIIIFILSIKKSKIKNYKTILCEINKNNNYNFLIKNNKFNKNKILRMNFYIIQLKEKNILNIKFNEIIKYIKI